MASFNKVILIGHLTADPELKQTTNGVPVTSFSIGVNRRFTRQGEQAQTAFINIVCWRQTAEFVTRFFRKGNPILICGSLQTRSWDRQGRQQTLYHGGGCRRGELRGAQVRFLFPVAGLHSDVRNTQERRFV